MLAKDQKENFESFIMKIKEVDKSWGFIEFECDSDQGWLSNRAYFMA